MWRVNDSERWGNLHIDEASFKCFKFMKSLRHLQVDVYQSKIMTLLQGKYCALEMLTVLWVAPGGSMIYVSIGYQ